MFAYPKHFPSQKKWSTDVLTQKREKEKVSLTSYFLTYQTDPVFPFSQTKNRFNRSNRLNLISAISSWVTEYLCHKMT